jgi:hypothetical protein
MNRVAKIIQNCTERLAKAVIKLVLIKLKDTLTDLVDYRQRKNLFVLTHLDVFSLHGLLLFLDQLLLKNLVFYLFFPLQLIFLEDLVKFLFYSIRVFFIRELLYLSRLDLFFIFCMF